MAKVRAPELPSDFIWLNCDHPLTLAALRGQVVLLDFWTAGCINCLHILPDLHYLEQKYQDQLTIIGVHAAKFDHEQAIDTVRQALLKFDITHPVLVDQNFYVWDQYAVRAWPTLMVIDPAGYVIGYVSGEGHREALDELIGKIIPNAAASTSRENFRLTSSTRPLAFPGKVLADEPSDALFIADSGHHRIVISNLNGLVIQVIGQGQPGSRDGTFTAAKFHSPQGLAFDRQHHCLYVADSGNHTIRKIDLKRQVVATIAGTGQQSLILAPHGGRALATDLNSPWDLQLIGDALFIAMAGSHQIWQLQLTEAIVMTSAGTGAEGCFDGLTTEAAFAQPSGITTDGSHLLIADSETSSIRAVELSGLGDRLGLVSGLISGNPARLPRVATLCGSGDQFGFGDADGQREAVRLQHCLGVDYAHQHLWVADTYNHKIKRVNQLGQCQTVLGTGQVGHQDGEGRGATFAEPSGLSATSSHLYIADTNNHAIRQVDLRTWAVSTIAFPNLCAPGVCVP
jgi:thiol-disulfide isomerase/thioredoxin